MSKISHIGIQRGHRRNCFHKSNKERHQLQGFRTGGARRVRTDDLRLAKAALSQLSYGPVKFASATLLTHKSGKQMVGLGRLELPTSRLSGVRSNQLSYRPNNWFYAHPALALPGYT